MKKSWAFTLTVILSLSVSSLNAQLKAQKNILVLYENGGHHLAFSKRAAPWLDSLAQQQHYNITYLVHTDKINADFLSKYQLILQLDYPPYAWNKDAVKAFEAYIDSGKGSWIGLHHATLLGEFDGYPIWDWFYNFMGQIRFKNYIATFASGTVHTEKPGHPIFSGVDSTFKIEQEEWYTYDKSPRNNVNVLAHVDENSYQPPTGIKMGDHPVIWTNPSKPAKNLYIFMGHSPDLFSNNNYRKLLRNAILWSLNDLKSLLSD